MLQVVNRKYRTAMTDRAIPLNGVQKNREKTGCPIMAMKNIGDPIEIIAQVDCGTRQEGKPLVIVVKIAIGVRIDAVAVIIAVKLEEIDG